MVHPSGLHGTLPFSEHTTSMLTGFMRLYRHEREVLPSACACPPPIDGAPFFVTNTTRRLTVVLCRINLSFFCFAMP